MEWILNNWYLILSLLAIVSCGVVMVMKFLKMPTAQQIENVKEWLKIAVYEAEKKLGDKTGQLKLRMVYDMAIAKFPWISTIISFETFGKWVDEALVWLANQLESNEAVKQLVKGE